ncbi:MAG: LysR family transcriptional regulator [Proteobacteria bacterium]|nr:LysR family transcriptional regulator [Pseudomonadota bacterium]
MRQLSQLDGLIAFVTVARHRGFSAAAGELGVSSPALSQAVRQLEQRLGVRLFHRTTRSVALTEAGEQFMARVGPAVAELFEATESLDSFRDTPKGLLRLNAGRVVAATVLRRVIPPFRAAHPEVQVEVCIDDGFTDIVAEGFDAGFRLGESVGKDMVALPFGPPMSVAVVGSPAYLHGRPVPKKPADLASHELIRYRFNTSGQIYKWDFVCAKGQPLVYETHGGFICNDSMAMLDAALDGLGLAYSFDIAVQEHLDAGRLVRVLQEHSPRHPGFHIYFAGHRQIPPKLKRFIEFGQAMLRPQPARQPRHPAAR